MTPRFAMRTAHVLVALCPAVAATALAAPAPTPSAGPSPPPAAAPAPAAPPAAAATTAAAPAAGTTAAAPAAGTTAAAPPAPPGAGALPAADASAPATPAAAPPGDPAAQPPVAWVEPTTAAPPAPAEAAPAPATHDGAGRFAPQRREPVVGRFHLALNGDAVWFKDRSFDLFAARDVSAAGGVSFGYTVWTSGALSVAPEVGYAGSEETSSSLLGGALAATRLSSANLYAGGILRYELLPFLDPHVRAALGAAFVDVSVTPASGPSPLETSDTSPYGTLGAGFTLHTPKSVMQGRTGALRRLMLGISVEGGYLLGRSVDLTLTPAHPTGRIPTTDARLGTLDRSGPYFRGSLVVRF